MAGFCYWLRESNLATGPYSWVIFPVVLVGSARLVYPQKRKCERAVHDGEKVPEPDIQVASCRTHGAIQLRGWAESR